MSQEERVAWDQYFAAAISGLLAKPPASGPGQALLSGMSADPQAVVNKAAIIADRMMEERRKR